jgi:translation initiation factor 2 gamma subunit (eIF-2gamma)
VNGKEALELVNGIEMKAPTKIVGMNPKVDVGRMITTEVVSDLVIGRGRELLNRGIGIMIGIEDTEIDRGDTLVVMTLIMMMERSDLKDEVRMIYTLVKERYEL